MSLRIGATAYALVAVVLLSGCGHPSDHELISRFQKHRADFEKLLRMTQEDSGVRRIAPDFLTPTDSLSEDRWNAYRELFDQLELADGVANWNPSGPIEFTVSSRGLVTGGDSKGYAYFERAPSRLHDSLDSRPSDSESNVPIYRSIGDGWYLYYSWDD